MQQQPGLGFTDRDDGDDRRTGSRGRASPLDRALNFIDTSTTTGGVSISMDKQDVTRKASDSGSDSFRQGPWPRHRHPPMLRPRSDHIGR
jgi:hypothetical protein